MSLYIVHDDDNSYRYVVKAGTETEAIEIIKERTGHKNWMWDVDVCDNDEVIERKE